MKRGFLLKKRRSKGEEGGGGRKEKEKEMPEMSKTKRVLKLRRVEGNASDCLETLREDADEGLNLAFKSLGSTGCEGETSRKSAKLLSANLDFVSSFSKALTFTRTLLYLDLSCNNFVGNAAFSLLCDSIAANETLLHLNLSANGIGCDGCADISRALEKNTALRLCDLRATLIGNRGAKALAKMLRKNRTLQALNVSANYISDASSIADALRHSNRTLLALNMSRNDFDVDEELADSVNGNGVVTLNDVHFRSGEIDASDLGGCCVC